jgi:hypothetical protein
MMTFTAKGLAENKLPSVQRQVMHFNPDRSGDVNGAHFGRLSVSLRRAAYFSSLVDGCFFRQLRHRVSSESTMGKRRLK